MQPFRGRRFVAVALSIAAAAAPVTGTAFAYSRDNHETITSSAVELFNACVDVGLPGVAVRVTPKEREALFDYNDRQDQLLRKWRLWHFPEGTPTPHKSAGVWYYRWGVVHATWDQWIRYLVSTTEPEATPDKLYPALGATLHYVQDLAVPAHAVPIFHPSGKFQTHKDSFDNFEDYDADVPLEGEPLTALCESLDDHSALEPLLANVRSSTLRAIDGNWPALWPKHDVGPNGFANYGCDSHEFGEKDIDCNGVVLTAAAAKHLSGQQATAAIIASARAIWLFQQRHQPCPQGRECIPRLGDNRWLPNLRLLQTLGDGK